MTLAVVGGNTETAAIDAISAAGASSVLRTHTPAADLEILRAGEPVCAPVTPMSPTGCPTPAVVTRAVHELLALDVVAIDAGLAGPIGVETVDLGGEPGADVREPVAVPHASAVFGAAREVAGSLSTTELVVGETIPGGTTTALAVLTALGEQPTVSSSFPDNPLELKRNVVDAALDASGLTRGAAAGNPIEVVRSVGDPVLAGVAGLIAGATDAGTDVLLAGGTQLAAAAALARHAGIDAPLTLATTSYLVGDESADVRGLAADLDLDLVVTDPGFDRGDCPALEPYADGVAKEGVGMGGALALADRRGVSMADVRERAAELAATLRSAGGPEPCR